ncbi:E3 ubiquitin-protein ligase RNF126 [Bombyx mandarina]|uniref:RING-type E3 ubiquitin transferase n=2 Tax=Bombyx TaxID=7090 RepID=A0A8R2M515_BOMMO|nr:E3 ubiquitin-protein ligase RNF126 [Bombyx mandarina]XP_037874453.1 E3 ubiquitin-protein ligase RNF126 isoform X2 [Bombyx mori]
MADAMVERRPTLRFFCHRCDIEFEDVLQDYTCPYCASGFIEQLESEADGDFDDADMSNLDDDRQAPPPMLNDLAFLMTGGRYRNTGRRDTILEQLLWMMGAGRPGTGATTAGAPFVLVGAPGDYVFGGEGLDAVVTQLLGQLENSGPPPLPRDQLAALPQEILTEDHAAKGTACSVCWENFETGETVSRLECEHLFHSSCISPWLQLHATCPICRRSLLPADPPPADTEAITNTTSTTTDTTATATTQQPPLPPTQPPTSTASSTPSIASINARSGFAAALQQMMQATGAHVTLSGFDSGSSGSGWPDTSSSSLGSDRYNMDIDYD